MKYRFYYECLSGGSHEELVEIDQGDIVGMTPDQIEDYVSDLYDDWMIEQVTGGYAREEDE